MTFTDLLSELDKLNRTDKLRVIQHLARVLEAETPHEPQSTAIMTGRAYEVWAPQDEGGAVAALHQALRDHRQQKREKDA